jgi:uncharacterized protein (TIGR02118 family)
MIRANVLYPAQEGAHFDFDYYLARHMPMVRDRLSPFGLTGVTVDSGIAGFPPGSSAAFVCVTGLQFDTLQNFQRGMAEHGAEIVGDIPNFTDIPPVVQVSDARI